MMAVLRYDLGEGPREFELPMYTGTPRHALIYLGSDSSIHAGAPHLNLPAERGIAPEHALIVETKECGPFFVLIDRGQGRVMVNGSAIARLRVLQHLDEIALGGTREAEPVRLRFCQLQVTRLDGPWECPVCCRECKGGDVVFDCPTNHRRRYCAECVLVHGFTCSCGYNFASTVRRVLQSLDLQTLEPRAKVERLHLQTVTFGSDLFNQHCTLQTVKQVAPHKLLNFQLGDQVVVCPQCDAPYHQGCWLAIPYCVKSSCKFPIRKLVERALLAGKDW